MIEHFWGEHGQKNGCGQSGDWTLKLTVSEKWTDGTLNWFLHVDTWSQKLKSWSKIFWVGHAQKWIWSVWSRDSKMNRLNKVKSCLSVIDHFVKLALKRLIYLSQLSVFERKELIKVCMSNFVRLIIIISS